MKTIAITLTGNSDSIATVLVQLQEQGIAVDVVDNNHLVAHIELDESNNVRCLLPPTQVGHL